jgi:2-isopropylmalate synthase
VVGRDAFRTGTGVHAAAIVKAEEKGDAWLADRIYSGIPASMVGRSQEIEIGPLSGLSNVRAWLGAHGYDPTDPESLRVLLDAAKLSDHTLTHEEIRSLLEED